MQDFKLRKPTIHEDKLLEPHEIGVVVDALKNQGRILIHVELSPAKNDYLHDYDRGTVHYTPRCSNYSFHKVIIPNGTQIIDANFSQLKKGTEAIFGENLIFVECNLVNNIIRDSWILDNCNTAQIDIESKESV